MTRNDLLPYVSYVLDDAGHRYPQDHPIPDNATLVAWQAGFEPVVVAVFSYLPGCTVDDGEAEALAVDLLTELDWFAGPPTNAAYICR